ncbi:DUF4913 domain-containing protein [Streptomyces sp. 351MFTsu5.1]|uniref:DUF4913 domain-containing protein n=1 Tax=Streptomyces sp. 351MFTsu5.1 TaxID=1172180 RepID=UPI0003772A66|nr:DUF4913 domain-containing protein [Streptomyces sp. 351MFTsu5.1]
MTTVPASDAGLRTHAPEGPRTEAPEQPSTPKFILYSEGLEYGRSLRQLTLWVHHVLLPVYGREVTSHAPWCSRWWEHPEAVAQLHGLWLAWAELSDTASDSGMTGPAGWHRDYLNPTMQILRDPAGPFAGCKPGTHRSKQAPPVDMVDPFGPPPQPPGRD